jgi:hypothetical protein
MARDEFFVVIEAEPIGISFEQDASTGVLGRNGVLIGIEADAKLIRGAHGFDQRAIEGRFGER